MDFDQILQLLQTQNLTWKYKATSCKVAYLEWILKLK